MAAYLALASFIRINVGPKDTSINLLAPRAREFSAPYPISPDDLLNTSITRDEALLTNYNHRLSCLSLSCTLNLASITRERFKNGERGASASPHDVLIQEGWQEQ